MKRLFGTVVTLAILSNVGVAFAAEPDSMHEQAIAALLKSGVKVDRNATMPGRPVTRIFFGCHRSPGSLVQQLKHVPEVQVMNLRLDNDVTAEDLESLRSLVSLNDLLIHHCPINDQSLAHLQALPNLRKLRFSSTPITDRGVKQLAAMKQLEHLSITGKEVTDRSMVYLEKLTNLKELRLRHTSVGEQRLAELRSALPDTKIRND